MSDKQDMGVVTQADTRLWCLHHIGADEVHPAPDFATAQQWANWANERFADYADISRFVVAVWPWEADRHAISLQKAIYEWAVSALASQADQGEIYRHVKRGTSYSVVGIAELQMAQDILVDGSSVVVYRGDDGRLWVREEGEFHDGRFEKIATHPHPSQKGEGDE